MMSNPVQQGSNELELYTGSEIIKPIICSKLLGLYASDDKHLKHLKLHNNSAVKVFTTRPNALRRITLFAKFKIRKMKVQAFLDPI